MSAEDYLDEAGGYAQFADDSLAFIILPDGKAEKVETSWFSIAREDIPPGSTIVVPRDLRPYDTRQLVLDVDSDLRSARCRGGIVGGFVRSVVAVPKAQRIKRNRPA